MDRPAVPTPTPAPPSALAGPAIPRRWRRALARLIPAIPLIPVAGAGWFVNTFNPTDPRHEVTGPCTWHALTGINGPTCGGTRAFYYLIHGNLIEAIRFHLPFVIAVPFFTYWWICWAAEAWFGRRLPPLRPRLWMVLTYVVATLVFTTVLRNLPVPALAWFDIPNLTHRMI